MSTCKTLNPIDLVKEKKRFYWNQNYYGLYEEKKLKSYLVFKKYYESNDVLEIKNIIDPKVELLKDFVSDYGNKGIKYFIRELDEKSETEEFQIMQNSGFKRFKRNYCFEYQHDGSKSLINNPEGNLNFICREAYSSEIDKVIELEKSTQALEYRDYLYRDRKSYIKNSHDTYVFRDPHNSFKKYALCSKVSEDTYEFIVHPNSTGIIITCIEAFAEIQIKYHRKEGFNFIINDSHKSIIPELENRHKLLSSSQVLIAEGHQRKKVKAMNPWFFPKRATS